MNDFNQEDDVDEFVSATASLQPAQKGPLRRHIAEALEEYFDQLDGHAPNDLYTMVIQEVEAPLLEVVMRRTGGNQSRAAAVLGINRNTLRKKLQHHALDYRNGADRLD